MPGRMKRNPDTAVLDRLAVRQRVQRDASQPGLEQSAAGISGEVVFGSGTGVIGMSVCDNGAIDRVPRVDVKSASRAV
jgi:hypothetical protein